MHSIRNHNLRDEIKDYWGGRAASFDQDPSHKITPRQRGAWEALFARHLGAAEGRRLLDLASGTGEIALLCQGLGYHVTGLDWAEPMLERARAKAPEITFLQADAERIPLPNASQEVIVTRHLVWTLVEPAAAFAEWFRVLAPKGRLLIVDGDFVSRSWLGRLLVRLSAPKPRDPRHTEILARVHFSAGARAAQVAALLAEAGFTEITVDTDFAKVHRAQAAELGWRKSLLRRSEHRYVISATKP